MTAPAEVSPLDAPLAPSPLDAAYSERARLVAFLSRVYPSHWAEDPESPGWPVICVHSPAGQLCWHIGPNDVHLFPPDLDTRANDWDGHSTEEKYGRLARLGAGVNPLRLRAALRRLRNRADQYALSADVAPRVREGFRRALLDAAERSLDLLDGNPCDYDEFPRRFRLERDTDVSGVSGTGVVADGVVWPDGSADVRWRGDRPSAVHWDRASHAEAIHGHGGATRFVYLD